MTRALPGITESMELSRDITCEADILNLLIPDTIKLANWMGKDMALDEYGVIVQITDKNNLHRALALKDPPAQQGADADASLVAFQDWLRQKARAVHSDCEVPSDSEFLVAFHHLDLIEAHGLAYHEWHPPDE